MEFASYVTDCRKVRDLWSAYTSGNFSEYDIISALKNIKSSLESRGAVTKKNLNKPENRQCIRETLEDLASDKNVRLIPSKPTGFSTEKMVQFNLIGFIDTLLEHPSLDVKRLDERNTEDYKNNVNRHDQQIENYTTKLDRLEEELSKCTLDI